MKKTVTANIAGTVFHIEEDAYEQLQRYLAGIRANFSGSPGAEDIMADIEARIAELFTERLQGRDVVTIADTQHVESVMGRPEDFAGESDGAGEGPRGAGPSAGKTHRRFMRDPEDKWLGGLLGGLGAYINVDPLWLRVAFIVLCWPFHGTPVMLYLLLWILVPKAATAAEKLQMRGEPVTVDNLKKMFEEGGEKVRQGAERVAGEAKDLSKEWAPRAEAWGHAAQRRAHEVGRNAPHLLSRIIGIILILVAFGFLLSLVTGLIGGTVSLWHATWSNDELGLLDMGGLLFNSRAHAAWFGIGVFVLLAVPVVGLFLAGFRLLLDTRSPRWLGWSLAALWFAALIPTVVTAIDLGMDFRRENSVGTEAPILQPTGDVLYLDVLAPAGNDGEWSVQFDNGDLNVDFEGLHVKDGEMIGAWADLDVERSTDSLYHLKVVREAHGRTAKAALIRAERIIAGVEQNGDALLVSPLVRYPADDKIRGQDIHFTLEVPLGKSIFLREGSRKIIYDIDNVTNTLDREMLGHTWTMTPDGLDDKSGRRRWEDRDGRDSTATDTIVPRKVAASVVRLPRPKNTVPPKPEGHPVTAEPDQGVQLPNLMRLLSRAVRI